MNANFSKRFSAFVIDIIVVSIICSMVTLVIPKSSGYENLNNKLIEVAESYTEKIANDPENIDMNIYKDYIEEVSPISYQIEKQDFMTKIVLVIIYILYYVLYQFKNNGQTLGKRLMKIKIEKEEGNITINDLLFRSFIVNSVLTGLINIVLLFTTNNINYLIATEIISLIFGTTLLISGIMCIARKDKKTLQDLITKTKVVEMG